jgi:hypothetical protein
MHKDSCRQSYGIEVVIMRAVVVYHSQPAEQRDESSGNDRALTHSGDSAPDIRLNNLWSEDNRVYAQERKIAVGSN